MALRRGPRIRRNPDAAAAPSSCAAQARRLFKERHVSSAQRRAHRRRHARGTRTNDYNIAHRVSIPTGEDVAQRILGRVQSLQPDEVVAQVHYGVDDPLSADAPRFRAPLRLSYAIESL